jgi:hypothetical protein
LCAVGAAYGDEKTPRRARVIEWTSTLTEENIRTWLAFHHPKPLHTQRETEKQSQGLENVYHIWHRTYNAPAWKLKREEASTDEISPYDGGGGVGAGGWTHQLRGHDP